MARHLHQKPSLPSGFTLLEVVITLAILSTMMIAVTSLLRSSFDVRFALSDEAKLTHRLNVAVQKIADDLAHAYIISSKDTKKNYNDRNTKTIFSIEKNIGGGDKLAFTAMSHLPLRYNANEGDSAYIVYEIRDAKENPGRKHLYRGVLGKIPEDFKQDPPMVLLAKHIKAIDVQFWNGESWSQDKWTSERSETKDLMPQMIKLTVEAWVNDPDEEDPSAASPEESDLSESYSTVVFLQYAAQMKELKLRPSTAKM